jgi:AcrR family transcriptional regulator
VAARPRTKPLKIKRRKPQRSNGRETVAAIFESTARILQSEGLAGLNTNRIAERAGVSIGALYGYFPNKQAILLAMARRELDLIRDRVTAALTDTGSAEPDPARRAIRALIAGYNTRGRSRRILMETLFAHGGNEDMERPVYEVSDALAAHAPAIFPGGQAPSRMSLFILTRAVDGVIRTASYEGVAFLASREFEDELVRLVYGFLGQAR